MVKNIITTTLVFLLFAFQLPAQDSLSIREAVNMQSRALEHVERNLKDVLNSIANSDNDNGDIKFIKENSYSGEKRVFLKPDVIIEDDVDPSSKNANSARDVKVEQYLTDFDLQYSKSPGASIVFKNPRASNPKKGNGYIFVKIYYSSFFSNENTTTEKKYTPNDRVAEVRMEKKENKWIPYIQSISFFDPKDTLNDYADEITINNPDGGLVTDSSYNIIREKEIFEEQKKAKEEELAVKRKFDELIDKGDKARDSKDFTVALQYYMQAKEERPFDQLPRKRIRNVQTMQAEATLTHEKIAEGYIRNAQNEEKKRNYQQANKFYYKAISENPDLKEKYESTIRDLNDKWKKVYELRRQFDAGVNNKDLVDQCSKAIKKNESNSDLYLERAKNYDKLNNWDKAIRDCDLALQYDNRNLPALKLRADVKKKRNEKGDYFSAATDYEEYLTIYDEDSTIYELSSDLRLMIKPDDFDKAISDLDDGTTKNPKWAHLYYKKGLLLDRKNDARGALKNFDLALANDSTYALSYFEHGNVQLKLNNIDNAALDFEKARNKGLDSSNLKIIDTYSQKFSSQASDKFNASKTDSAIKLIDYAISISPGISENHFKKGDYFIANDNNNEAIISLTRATDLNKNFTEAWYKLGLAYANLRKFEIAVPNFKKAVVLDNRHLLSQKGLADAYYALKDYNNAAQNYQTALTIINASKNSIDPSTISQVYNSMGKSYFLINESDEKALEAFKNAVKKNPVYAEAYFNRGLYYHRKKELNNAIEDLENAVSFDGKNPSWNYELALTYQDKKDLSNAVKFYNLVMSQDSLKKYPVALYQAAVCNYELQDYNAALKNYHIIQSLGMDSGINKFNYELGNIYLNLNRTDSASLYLEKAYLQDSTNGNILYSMGIVQLQKSKQTDALAFFDKSFKTGQINQKQIKNDKLLAAFRDDKNFKFLIKKYF